MGHREYQLSELPKQEDNPQPELTRKEYLQLLQAAKRLDREREYLLVKLFASCDLPVQELGKVTVEAAKAGGLTVDSSGTHSVLHLPGCLCRELLAYARRNGVNSGAIFVGKTGAVVALSTVREQIKAVSRAAGMEDSATSARALQKLYETTRAELMAETVQRLMMEQLDREQAKHGWES